MSTLEESGEGIIPASGLATIRHCAIGSDPVLQAVQLPAGVSDLHASLTHVDAQTFPHFLLGLDLSLFYFRKRREETFLFIVN